MAGRMVAGSVTRMVDLSGETKAAKTVGVSEKMKAEKRAGVWAGKRVGW